MPTSAQVTAGTLARHGFSDARSALKRWDELTSAAPDLATDRLLGRLSAVADPDLALLTLVRLEEALLDGGHDAVRAELAEALSVDELTTRRLLAVLGASGALGDHLVRHPEHWRRLRDARPRSPEERRHALVATVTGDADGAGTAYDRLRIGYREQLLGIAALDLTAEDPVATMPETAAALADLASAALAAALEIARTEADGDAALCRLAIIGMGKCGGRELNYVSDVDVLFVAEPAEGADEDEAISVATQLATALMRACSASTGEGALWAVDAALRPEGRDGPLVRTLASHRHYYERWAKTWEFQALLKARVVAGDEQLGAAWLDTVRPLVWSAASREHFVVDVQAMRRRVEEHVPPAEAERQLKLGRGGLRDIEFSVQLLQLVHGRSDETLRSGTTLDALAALSDGGYVGRDDAAVLDHAYRWLRSLEHRIQLHRMRRTHLVPTGEEDLRRLGRSLGHRTDPASWVTAEWRRQAREVRRLHERLFYRPLLEAVAGLSTDEVRLSPEAARERLSALGFRDPAGAMRHLESLTTGLSRRAAIQRTLLPVMLGWFADEADPDAGLLAFRRLSDALGTTHWYLKMLRDEGRAAERLAHVLASSRYAGDLLLRAPESVALLGADRGLEPRDRDALLRTMRAAAGRQADLAASVEAVRVLRRQELLRIAIADIVDGLGVPGVAEALTALTEATLQAVLEAVTAAVEAETGDALGTRLAVIGMGRLGGGELGYASDADVLFVHEPLPGADPQRAQQQATSIAQELTKLLKGSGPDPALVVDADLRPEGRQGPIIRTLDSYRAYYDRWSSPWEAQALLRARPVAGDDTLGAAFARLIDPLRWPAGGLSAEALREVRTLKARMEAERLPRGADPKTHFKLGRGGLSDVEWTVQLLQMQHAHEVPALRRTGTVPALEAAAAAGLLTEDDAHALIDAWQMVAALRNASVLWRGRPVESLPSDLRDADGVGRLVGRRPLHGWELDEAYRRVARRARRVMERTFYGR
ncbi:MAG TPA: bifunctional [glutamine synthetase] adenylyltransferase/[glutamine synthetase]-adenylyl-L-tyrosine phosphorylase [Segeticoccus sp.]|uniref:bifunctional [glutamine synthetase] adenylyltransferase/[glutamine synthetase]-adenylyl-L-tyrosine phosphorylase n=1 Tax=Segeticoccus sp. TaxID=2706531 RepID=UPI002D7F4AFE|nr:bifunctional [glutamine synthetase] adenylyltransferase/[glutamine synthetase]-adenylyl-L-tyrosine phosphorylase [Segeticoccus sp.]HET8600688.1 bifunctional [glutamine synthetase] adenylyltransferase/[glutamine synthetase]-adenylyl-L-tyrosine phosphorylase [Segeticoccus sp.]